MSKPSAKSIRQKFKVGQVVTVTNHYITLPDHPCYGTHKRTIAKVTGSHLHFVVDDPRTTSGSVPWPKAADLRITWTGLVQFWGFPNPDALFLSIQI